MNDTFIIAWRSKPRRSLRPDEKTEETKADQKATESEMDFPLIDEEEREVVLI